MTINPNGPDICEFQATKPNHDEGTLYIVIHRRKRRELLATLHVHPDFCLPFFLHGCFFFSFFFLMMFRRGHEVLVLQPDPFLPYALAVGL